MRKAIFAFVAICALAAVAARADGPEPPATAKAELKKLQGTWTVTRAMLGGRERKADGTTCVFDGDKMTRTSPDPIAGREKGIRQTTFTVKLDTSKRPYRMELSSEAKGKGRWPARKEVYIYKIEKGELHLAVGKRGKAPAGFSGKDAQLFVMKKTKPKGKK